MITFFFYEFLFFNNLFIQTIKIASILKGVFSTYLIQIVNTPPLKLG